MMIDIDFYSAIQTLEELINNEPDLLFGITSHVERAIDLLRKAPESHDRAVEVERVEYFASERLNLARSRRLEVLEREEGSRARVFRAGRPETRSKSFAGNIKFVKTRSRSLAGKIRSYARSFTGSSRSFADDDIESIYYGIKSAAKGLEKNVLRYAYRQANSGRKGGALRKSTRLYRLALTIRYTVKEISEKTAALIKKSEFGRYLSGVQGVPSTWAHQDDVEDTNIVNLDDWYPQDELSIINNSPEENKLKISEVEVLPSTSAHQDDDENIKDSEVKFVPSTSYDGDDDDVDVVGFGKNIKQLVMHLTEEDNSHPIIHICGESGLGKTTLARKIYHHANIRSHFECFAWANVIEEISQVRGTWEDLLIELASPTTMEKKQIREMRDDEIAKTLFYILNHKKCLVILDLGFLFSKWWDRLKTAFPEDKTHSRVLIITPMTIESALPKNFIRFELHSLDEIESWELLKKKVDFGKIEANWEVKTKMRQLAQEMVRYCDGFPFAIILFSGLLSTSYEVSEWEKLHEDIKRNRTMDRTREDRMSFNVLLNLSYEKLPYHLKQCFLHLSHYPEKFDIRAKELCLIWMAEGFTSLSPDVKVGAYECLSELVKRCMVEVREWGSTGRIKTCYIHNFVRKFCLRKTSGNYFLRIVDLTREDLNYHFPLQTCRRLGVYMSTGIVDKLTSSIDDADIKDYFLRSFIFFNRVPYPDYEKVMKPLFNRYRVLRVLKFENLTCGYVGKLPKEIEKLRLLRFLSLKNSYVEHLPSSIGNLRSLQTLDLRTNWSVEFPNVMWKLKQLKHLYLPRRSSMRGNKLRLDTLSSLQTLVGISTEYSDLEDLMILKNLQKLKVLVNNGANLRKIFKSSSNTFDHLQSLAVEISLKPSADCITFMSKFRHICKLHIEGKISKLPEDYQNLHPNLHKLTLQRTCLESDPMVTLEKLENLRILLLDCDSFNGANMVCSTGGFPRLESLSLVGLENLVEWKVEEGALKILRSLQIEYCYNLKTIPNGLRYVFTLKKMVIRRMPRDFKMMFEQEGKKTYNIPNVTITELLD